MDQSPQSVIPGSLTLLSIDDAVVLAEMQDVLVREAMHDEKANISRLQVSWA